ncbi:hypothetical protein QQM79_14360 [Marinobacteraceae bacterium S3BR75-40.1]
MAWLEALNGTARTGLLIEEEMSGWLELEGRREPFSIRLEAFTDRLFRLTVPRAFTAVVHVGDSGPLAAEGTLTLYPTGPAYDISFVWPGVGAVNALGKKQYRLSDLKTSLTTCPLTVTCDGEPRGQAELVYRKPLWRFPLESLRLTCRPAARS